MKAVLRRLLIFGVLLVCGGGVAAYADQPVPPFRSYVTDLTGTLSSTEASQIEATLSSYARRRGSQIAVLIVPTTEPDTIEQYGIRVVDQWKLGRKGVDDGALLLVAKNDRATRIEVGRGLEGSLTDLATKRIIAEVIVPQFRSGNFSAGIRAGIEAILRVIAGEALPPPEGRDAGPAGLLDLLPFLFFLLLVLGGIVNATFGRFFGSGVMGLLVFLLSLLFVSVLASFLFGLGAFFVSLMGIVGPHGYGYRRGWSSGGFGGFGGGFGGGGFSGGGGGGFSGGGASGRW